MMSGSKRFLLFLVLVSVICVVLVQVAMDGKNMKGTIQYENVSFRDHGHNNGYTSAAPQNILPALHLKQQVMHPSTKPTKLAPKVSSSYSDPTKKPVISKPLTTFTERSPLKNATTISFVKHLRPSPNAANVQLISKQDRLKELLRQSNLQPKRMIVDPVRSVKSLPAVDPETVTRIFIITYFRAGSSFFGDILQQNWKTFYHFEPLHSLTYDKRIEDDKASSVFKLFDHIFECNFTEERDYINWARKPRNQFLFVHNRFLWSLCHSSMHACFDATFINSVCKRAPVHLMKLTRLPMRHLKTYLNYHEDKNFKVVYLTRDPRAIISSRWALDWCNATNCSDASILCHDMHEDVEIFNELQHHDPLSFIQVRYEDLVSNAETETKKLLKFLNLPFSVSVQKFLKSHTVGRKSEEKNPYSTRRNSTAMVSSWYERFTYSQVVDVQSKCGDVLEKLNHSIIVSPDQLPYPNGRTSTTKVPNEKLSRYHQNPLAKQYFMRQKALNVHNNTETKMSHDSVSKDTEKHNSNLSNVINN